MFCQKCGKQLLDGAKFCSYCGFRITYAAPAAPPTTAGEQPPKEEPAATAPATPETTPVQPAATQAAPDAASSAQKSTPAEPERYTARNGENPPPASEVEKAEPDASTPVGIDALPMDTIAPPKAGTRKFIPIIAGAAVLLVILVIALLVNPFQSQPNDDISLRNTAPASETAATEPSETEEPTAIPPNELTRDDIIDYLTEMSDRVGCPAPVFKKSYTGKYNESTTTYRYTFFFDLINLDITETQDGIIQEIYVEYDLNAVVEPIGEENAETGVLTAIGVSAYPFTRSEPGNEFTARLSSAMHTRSDGRGLEGSFSTENWFYGTQVMVDTRSYLFAQNNLLPPEHWERGGVTTEPDASESSETSADILLLSEDVTDELSMTYGDLEQKYGSAEVVDADYAKMSGTAFTFAQAPRRVYNFKYSGNGERGEWEKTRSSTDLCERVYLPLSELFLNFGDGCTVAQLRERFPGCEIYASSAMSPYGCPVVTIQGGNGSISILLGWNLDGSMYELDGEVDDELFLRPEFIGTVAGQFD